MARYTDANSKMRTIGRYASEDEAARAVNAAIRRAGLEGKRNINAVDATTGALVPRERTKRTDRSAVVTPDAGRAPTEPTSKFWGVRWDAQNRRWRGDYKDADGKSRSAGLHDTQELAAHAYNAAVRALPADVQARRKTNPVVDGQLVPKPSRKRRRADAPAARRTSAHAAPVPQTSDKKPCANCGGRPCDGVEFERFASSGKRHKTCTACKADRNRTLRKVAARRLLVNPKP